MTRPLKIVLGVTLAAGLFMILVLALYQPSGAEGQNFPGEAGYVKDGHPKMDSVLDKLVRISETQGIKEAEAYAALRQVDLENGLVRVALSANAEGTEETAIQAAVGFLKLQVENLRGRVEVATGSQIQGLVPLDSLRLLAELPTVKYLRLPEKPKLTVTSEGVAKTGADRWLSLLPYHSAGAKIAVLDLGFKGYRELLGKELPASVVTRSFRSDQDIFANEVHGTACAEIIHDMAPDAQLWLVNFSTDLELLAAVDWIISQKVDIISYSVGSYVRAGNGTGPACEAVRRAHEKGIIWVSSAGNAAQEHWSGTFNDPDGDGDHSFSGNDELLEFQVPANHTFTVILTWDDWGTWNGTDYSGSNQDYDLLLYIRDGANYRYLTRSENFQTGYQWPVEYISGYSASFQTWWAVRILKYKATRNVKFDLFVHPVEIPPLEYNVPSGSLLTPADSPFAVAVGAVDWRDDSYHAYSSQGPTADGRTKPDLCAPSAVSTASYGTGAFYGTSASCPHVAGAFALLKSLTPFSPEHIRTIIEARAIDLGAPGADNTFGLGRLSLFKKSSSATEAERGKHKSN